jgi:hypothetical protein
VTSNTRYWPALATAAVEPLPAPQVAGKLAAVTPASVQAEFTACNSTAPAVPMRLTYSTRLALTTLAAVAAAGSVERSKRSSAVCRHRH